MSKELFDMATEAYNDVLEETGDEEAANEAYDVVWEMGGEGCLLLIFAFTAAVLQLLS